jgi:hypothetical protein
MSNEDVKKLKFAAQAIETTASIKANGMLQDMKVIIYCNGKSVVIYVIYSAYKPTNASQLC